MKFLSPCSGIEAASVAFRPLGWEAVGFAEINPFASAVLAHRYPEVPKARWEALVGQACKRGFSTFFNKELHEKGGRDSEVSRSNCVQAVVEWAKTGRGGRQLSFMSDFIELSACSSAYGLCE